MRSRISSFVLLIVPALLAAQTARQQSAATHSEPKTWTTPFDAKARPRDAFADNQGRVWFVGQEGNYVAHFEPDKGTFKKFEIEPGTNPHNLVVDKAGTVWFTGNRNGRIVKMDPNTGKLTNFMMPLGFGGGTLRHLTLPITASPGRSSAQLFAPSIFPRVSWISRKRNFLISHKAIVM